MTSPEYTEIYAAPVDQPAIARKLLAAADEAGIEQDVVRTTSDGFRVPSSIAEAAGYSTSDAGAIDARTARGDAIDLTSIPADVARADILNGHAPESLPAKVDGGPATLTDQRLDGPADTADRPDEVQVAAETGAVVQPDPRTADAGAVELADGTQTDVLPADAAVAPVALEDLKGDALDEALRAAELSTAGRADEKRARLAAFRAGQ